MKVSSITSLQTTVLSQQVKESRCESHVGQRRCFYYGRDFLIRFINIKLYT